MACEQEQATYNAAVAAYDAAKAAVDAIKINLAAAEQVATNRFNDMAAAEQALLQCQGGGGSGQGM
jgi:hypothetical protein